jgi:diguanylate cyclase (GGDEF)-like protein/PAS domain S-box-containing protein
MFNGRLSHWGQHRLGYRLLGAIVLASAAFALVTSAVQLMNDYRRDLATIDEQLAQIERSSVDSLADSIWSFNETQIRLQLAGLLQQRDVKFVEVNITGGGTLSAGSFPDGRVIRRQYALRQLGADRQLGTLVVNIGMDGVYSRLAERATVIMVGETAKTFFLALLILFVVSRWVTRHLAHMADHTRRLRLDRLGEPLQLRRPARAAPDELDLVASALNDMSRELAAELERRAAIDSERARLFDAYEHNRFLLQAIIDNTPAMVFVKDLDGRFLLVNQRYRELITEGKDVVGLTVAELFSERHAESVATDQRVVQTEGPYEYELQILQSDGAHTYLAVKFPLRRTDGELFAVGCIATDITERKRAEERVRYVAQHDALTGLPNRLLLRDRLVQAIAQARRSNTRVGVMFIDLDYFKNINDSLGHEAGDRLLEAMSNRLRGCLREGDTVARVGGDEFVVSLLTLKDSHDAIPVTEKVLDSLRAPVQLGADTLHVTASIGVSLYPADGDDADALMRCADAAMYHAKEKGRDNCQFFTPQLNEAAQRRLSIASRLHGALQRAEFEMYFQPQVDLESGRVFAAEALIRWRQGDGSMIPPGEFIRIAEEAGQIVALGEWVLRESCTQAARWHAAGHTQLSLGVNLSPQQIQRSGFADMAERVLAETGLPPSALEMEITEGMLMTKSPENIAMLERLAALGIRLAIDDFGTGYSSLAYLQRFPINVVKIDQSFVAGIGDDANDTSIVTAIIAMAHSLRLKVVAEGVETARQVAFLKAHGCLAAQGLYFSAAVPAAQFLALLGRPLMRLQLVDDTGDLAPPAAL